MTKDYNEIDLKNNIKTKIIGNNIIFFDEITSTNDYLKENVYNFPEGSVVFAKSQTKGRGRRGDIWENSPNNNIFMSLLLKPDIQLDSLLRISLVCSLSIVKALKKISNNTDFQIKWPNDIIVNEKKICGILAEFVDDNLVIGIGMNVNSDSFPESIRNKATSLKMEGIETSVPNVTSLILKQVEQDYFTYLENGFLFFIEEYKKYCCNLNKKVKITTGSTEKFGEIIAINQDGTLLFKDENNETSIIYSNEVSVRGLDGYV